MPRTKHRSESIFTKMKKEHFMELASMCAPFLDIEDAEAEYETFLEVKTAWTKKLPVDPENGLFQLALQWYDSLPENPDYSVYGHTTYLAECWLCWILYSRKSVMALSGLHCENKTKSVLDLVGDCKTIVDLGCGCAYTTAGLKELCPSAEVYGTNIEATFQFAVAEILSERYNFNVISDFEKIHRADIVFASEYFEHIEDPIEHLLQVLEETNPRFLITANCFNGDAIGHFNIYHHGEFRMNGKEISRLFNNILRSKGYEQVKTTIWNSRPAIWRKIPIKNNNKTLFDSIP